MNNITLKHLRYFEALAEHGHFGRAAEACAISQPALSLQMKELEEIVGAPLIERGTRHIRLTALGETFAEQARDVLHAADELLDLGRTAKPFGGRLRLGAIPTIAPYVLPRVIKALAAAYPDVDLRPREAVTQKLIDALLDARLDAAIVALPISEPALVETPLFTEEFVFVRSAKDAKKPVPDAAGLRKMRLLLLEEGHCFRDQALSFCELSGSGPSELMEGSSLSTLVQMVGAGIGVTLIPDMAVPLETKLSSVSVARLPAPRPTRTVGMVWRKTNPLGDQLCAAAEIVKAEAAQRD